MHGANGQQADKERHQQRHACLMPSLRPSPLSESTSLKSFSKDGRKIDVGDCALFQAGDAPPFIGILRKVTVDKEGSVKLRVNWLYRPADLKLAKGVPIEAAPNEIFYSFHKDDTPAASLLHPCKVAFLRKGVELPSGVSAFVCRRVYDIANKRLYWLTDQDYTDEHQEEVDQLLNRTKLEMQAAVQSGAPSPRALSLPHADHAQIPGGKGKKRERSDTVHETISKRSKADDSESSFVKLERTLTKPEDIASITDKDGGLSSLNGVEKLVSLMQQDRNDGARKPIDYARRIMLAGVVASTEKQECRDRLVQLGGLAVLDDWLQEAHKGKGGDGGNPVDGDKVYEELLLIVLRALQKLPVDIDALRTCIVGKSVNNLRSHKNMEIQKRARKLVDTWKKRVDAEVKQSGEKPGTPGKQPSGDPLQSLTTKDVKSSGSSTKFAPNGSTSEKPAGSGSSKSPGSKENSPNNSTSNEIQGVPVKEENCASQSQNYGPTWSSAPVTSACKDDLKSSVVSKAKSTTLSKGDASTGQKDNGSVKAMAWSRATSNNTAERPVAAERSPGEAADNPSNQRLILRFPNPGKSPARANALSVEAQTTSKTSSPKRLDRSSSSGLAEAADGKNKAHATEGSPEKRHRTGFSSNEKCAVAGTDRGVVETRQNGKACEKSVRENHATAGQSPSSNGVDGGMCLLATVAADEILKCDGSCGTGSTARSVLTEEGNGDQDNMGTSSIHRAEQVPVSNRRAEAENITESIINKAVHSKEGCQDTTNEVVGVRRQNSQSPTDSHDVSCPQASEELAIGDPKPEALPEETNCIEGLDDKAGVTEKHVWSKSATERATCKEDSQAVVKTEAEKGNDGIGSPMLPEEDALEVARQVAKEVEQEMESYGKPVSSDADVGKDGRQSAETVSQKTSDEQVLTKAADGECASGSELKVAADENQIEKQPSGPQQCASAAEQEGESATGEGCSRPLFDLNEGFPVEESPDSVAIAVRSILPQSSPPVVSALTAPIAVMASTSGSFIPPASPLKTNKEAGWKPAATSAFRPAEPRASHEKKVKPAFDIDLNVADERFAEDAGPNSESAARDFLPSTSAVLGSEKMALDLNQANESEEGGSLQLRPPGTALNGGNVQSLRNFDLNDGPSLEDSGGEESFLRNFNLSSKPKANPMIGSMNGELLNLSSWFPAGSSFSSVAIPGFSGPRPEQPGYSVSTASASHPFVNGGATPFASDLYRAGGASSSTVGYQANPYSYPAFPFSSSFPFSSASTFVTPSGPYVGSSMAGSFSAISSQVVHPGATAAFVRPSYLMGIAEGGGFDNGSWGRRSLDLNAGPDPPLDPDAARQQQQQQSYVLPLEDQMRAAFHQQAGASLKRKEPESGWDVYRGGFKWR